MPTTRSGARLPPPVVDDIDIPEPAEDTPTPSVSGQPDHEDESEPSVTDDDDEPNDPPTPRGGREITPARLLQEIISANKRPETVKPRDPDTFDGSDAKKLKSFLVQCQLNFLDRPGAFRSDSRKINYVLSFLRGFALEWFEPMILDGENHQVLSNYKTFVSQLTENFGPYDAVREAEFELERLRMREDQKLTKYTISFNRFAAVVHWDEYALQRQFYKGLASRIKDELARVNRADTLRGLREQASAIDSRYWARQQEISRDSVKAPTPNNNNKKETSDNSKSSTPAGAVSKSDKPSDKRPANSGSNVGTSGSKSAEGSGNSGGSSDAKKSHLGQDGKLTPEERQRRFDNNLCLFCGAAGHKANECRKRTSRANASAARVTSEGDDSVSKND